ncbi:S8 family serine peptidase [Puia sp.]|uniref:S8 family serine peptidase n=1 Tax=Puia sp. TaxID=2045100 RepID=UPI002F3F160C
MKRLLPGLAAIFSLCILLPRPTSAQVHGDPAFPGVAAGTNITKSSSTLSPDLQRLAGTSTKTTANTKAVTALTKPNPPGVGDFTQYMQIRGNNILIDVTAKEDIATASAELRQLGATITSTYGRVISATIPISALGQLEGASGIRFARPAYKPLHVGRRNTVAHPAAAPKPTPVISQGDTAQLSYQARKKYKVDGSGVKVGILSDSYNNLGGAATGVAHGELPGPANPFGYKTPVQVLSDLDSTGTDEGRAMMEIVHDVAPAATLAFHTADNGQADFANGILQLANRGCAVIGDDVAYFAEPFFQDGIIAQAVDEVKSRGVTYFSAAGNESIKAYASPYQPTNVAPLGTDAGTAHNFSGPGDPPRYFQPIYIPPGGIFISSFQWDQSSFSASGVGDSTDMDMYLLNSAGQVVAFGASDNIASGDPIEVFGYQNNTKDVTFYLVILKFFGPDPQNLKYILYDDALFYLTNPAIPGILSPTIVGHAKAAGAIAVGAAFYLQTPPYGLDTPAIEGFSSVGGVPNYYDVAGNRIAPLIRAKPDITAPDGGNTSFFDPFGNGDISEDKDSFPNFFGTSAATPHAAGVAALMIDAQKLHTITPAQIKGVLQANTWDMDNPYTTGFDKGFDFASGYGLIKATGAVGEVKFPNNYVQPLKLQPLCSANPSTTRNWQISNPNPFEVPVTWFVVGSNQHGSFIVQPGDTTFSTPTLVLHNFPLPMVAVISWQDNFDFPRLDLAYSTKAVCGKDAVSVANSDQFGATTATGKTLTPDGKPTLAEVYPNPSTGVFRLYLSLDQPQDVILNLYSADGRQLQTRRVSAAMGAFDIDASAYRPGIYFLKVIQGGDVKTIKLVKK